MFDQRTRLCFKSRVFLIEFMPESKIFVVYEMLLLPHDYAIKSENKNYVGIATERNETSKNVCIHSSVWLIYHHFSCLVLKISLDCKRKSSRN